MSLCDLCGWYAYDKETFLEHMPMVKRGHEFGEKEELMKEKTIWWKQMHFYLCCYEERIVLCVDGIDGDWEWCRICCATMGVTSVVANLVCPLVPE